MGTQIGIAIVRTHPHKHLAHGDITHGPVDAGDIPKQIINLPIGHHVSRRTTTAVILISQAL